MSAEEIIEQRNLFHAGNYQSSVNAGISLNLSGDSGVLSIFPSLPFFSSSPPLLLSFSPSLLLLLLSFSPSSPSSPSLLLSFLSTSVLSCTPILFTTFAVFLSLKRFPLSLWARFLHHRAVSALAPRTSPRLLVTAPQYLLPLWWCTTLNLSHAEVAALSKIYIYRCYVCQQLGHLVLAEVKDEDATPTHFKAVCAASAPPSLCPLPTIFFRLCRSSVPPLLL